MNADDGANVRRLLLQALEQLGPGSSQDEEDASETIDDLREQVERLRLELESARSRQRVLEEQNDQLANLYVASHQLHSTMDLDVVLALLGEVLLNLLGVQRYVLAIGSMQDGYEIIAWHDHAAETPPTAFRISTEDEVVARALAARQPMLVEPPTPRGTSAAIVPLRLMDAKEEVFGLLLIEQLLPQKSGFSRKDEELLTLLSSQAGSAIYTAITAYHVGSEFEPVAVARAILGRRG